jgi:hypothetical protein
VPPRDTRRPPPSWALPETEPLNEVVSSLDETRRPTTTPHHQKMTVARQVAVSGVGPVSLSIERQVSMATAAALAAGRVSLPRTSVSIELLRSVLSTPPSSPSSRPSTQPVLSPLSGRADGSQVQLGSSVRKAPLSD